VYVCVHVLLGEIWEFRIMFFVGVRTTTTQTKAGNAMSELIKALTSLLASAQQGRWASTGRKALDPKSGKERPEYKVLAPQSAGAGEAIIVRKRTGEISLFVLTEMLGTHTEAGVISHFWDGVQHDPFTGQPISAQGSRATVTLR